jgi:Tol biopolymer transport system component/predicted Ser/Thr protein kinase
MSIPAGEQLGPYRIVESIGVGGMGEVYRSRDSRLNRDVAIKVSAERFSERFSREAQAIAALNHPNVCHLYDVGPNYLVMELVEGETLAARIRAGALPLDEAMAIARQIADALDAAHEKGIIHRDLKPGNIKIKPDGTVKVLDFGLAKTGGMQLAPSENSPTITGAPATEVGVIMGTAAYMAPEQARGKPVDKRVDIWAFGVVLYEMVTGKRLFQGDTTTEILAGVLKEEPNWDTVPPALKRLLRRCLERDPQKRLRHIGDVMSLVDEQPLTAAGTVRAVQQRSWLWPGIAAILLIGLTTLGYLYLRGTAPVAPENQARFQIPAPTGTVPFSLSPDGRRLVYGGINQATATSQLWVRTLDSLEAHPLPDTEGAGFTFWSPDSRFVAFVSQQKLKKVDVSGGPAQIIGDLPSAGAFRGGSWNEQGDMIIGLQGSPLLRVSASGGTPVPVTALDAKRAETAHFFPSFLPDGRHFVYLAVSGNVDNVGVYSGTLDAKPEEQQAKLVVVTNAGPVFTPPWGGAKAQLLYMRSGSIVTHTLDTASVQLTGDPVPVAEGVGTVTVGVGRAAYAFVSVSSNGALVYRVGPNGADENAQLTWYSREGKALSTVGDPGPYQNVLLAPDQVRASVVRGGDIWIMDLMRGTSTRLTTEGAVVQSSGVWSRDGKRVAYAANLKGVLGIYRKASDGSGTEDLVWKGEGVAGPSDWSPDGRYMMFSVTDSKTSFDQWWVQVEGEGERKAAPFLNTEFQELASRLSPDGKWVAYFSNRSGRTEIYVQPFNPEAGSAPAAEFVVSKGGAIGMPRWRSDGKEIFYLSRDSKFMAVEVSTSPSFHAGEPKVLFDAPPGFVRTNTPGALADVAADGKRFLLVAPVVRAATQNQFTAVLNWTSILKR